jgi:hypothetical protein
LATLTFLYCLPKKGVHNGPGLDWQKKGCPRPGKRTLGFLKPTARHCQSLHPICSQHMPNKSKPSRSRSSWHSGRKPANESGLRHDACRPWDLNPTAADHCPAAPRDRLHRKRPKVRRLPHCASQADQNVPLGGSGDLRLFNPLELFAVGSS